MSYWIKLFADGTQEKGTDTLIARREASWSRGRLSSMIGVALAYAKKIVRIEGSGPYWQKDIITSSYNLPPRRIARQIGKKIHDEDIGWASLKRRGPDAFTIEIAKEKPSLNATQIKSLHVGLYVVVTIINSGKMKITVERNFHV